MTPTTHTFETSAEAAVFIRQLSPAVRGFIVPRGSQRASVEVFVTGDPRHVQFIESCESAGIPWFTYSGREMLGAVTVAAATSMAVSDEDIVRATRGPLAGDALGQGSVRYVQ